MTQGNKVRENRLRRMAERQGFALRKSHRRDPLALGYGKFWIVDPNDQIVAGDRGGLDIDEVDAWLTDPSRRGE